MFYDHTPIVVRTSIVEISRSLVMSFRIEFVE